MPTKEGIMKLLSSKIEFETPVGNVTIYTLDEGYGFEFLSGWNFGLHSDVPFASYDKCYTHIKGRMKGWLKEQKIEQLIELEKEAK